MSIEATDRSRSFDRFLTFIDAIVAIAITLLVLPLVDLTNDYTGTTRDLLTEHRAQFLAFGLSFVVIFRFWWSQHRMLADVTESSPAIVRSLAVWVFTIVVLPFPTALVAIDTEDDTATRILYIGTLTVSAAALALLAWSIGRTRQTSERTRRLDTAGAVFNAVYLLIALTISVAVPATSYYPLLLLLLSSISARLLVTPRAGRVRPRPARSLRPRSVRRKGDL
jgi:uncharacterized membrane protein